MTARRVKEMGPKLIKRAVNVRFFAAVFAAAFFFLPAPHGMAAPKTISQGEYVDAGGNHHAWHISAADTLIWGGQPYLPAGGLFEPRYLSLGQTEENWNADAADLALLKKHGVTSVLLMPTGERGGLMDLPPAAVQRVLSYLDDNGFQYGVNIAAFPRDPLRATVINPAIYRAPAPLAGNVTTFRNLGGVVAASYLLVNSSDGTVITSGMADISDPQTASVSLGANQGGEATVLLLYPQRLFLPDSLEGRHLPDIWSDQDDYRDALLIYLSKLRFGPGLRFFVDPLVNQFGFYGETAGGMIPSSDTYRLQFETWLQARYGRNLLHLNSSWNVRDENLPSFQMAVRLLPLWYQTKGIRSLRDPVTKQLYPVDTNHTQYWNDVRDFQTEAARSVMNELATALKSGVADVPVVYRWTQPSQIYLNNAETGYDGLLATSDLHGQELVKNAAGWTVSAIEQSHRSQWLIAQIQPSPGAKPSGYATREQLTTDRLALQSIGVKGYYVNALRRLPEADWAARNLLNAPDQLDWLHADAANFTVEAATLADFRPAILFYPQNIPLPDEGIRQFANGAWWLPTYLPGDELDLGRGMAGYVAMQPSGKRTIMLWSPDDSVHEAKFTLPRAATLYVTDVSGQPVKATEKKTTLTLPISKSPLLITGADNLPQPDGAVESEEVEAMRMVAIGKGAGIPMDIYDQRLYYVKNNVLSKHTSTAANTAYTLLRVLNAQLVYALSPYLWVEGEQASRQSFNSIVSSSDTSGGAYLWQDTDRPPPATLGSYSADFTFPVSTPGNYDVWAAIAPGPPGAGAASPITLRVDTNSPTDVVQPPTAGDTYSSLITAGTATRDGQFTWCRIGSAHFNSGEHQLTITLIGPAPATGRYTLGIDCLCITRGHFTPNGSARPPIQ